MIMDDKIDIQNIFILCISFIKEENYAICIHFNIETINQEYS